MPSAIPGRMFQQTELDNYKLQVELLQEKLQRSEEQRQQLEEKYVKIQKRRTEPEKSMKSKSRLKFEQFLDEQHERNERNKTIIQMLESIDEQAATLATKSERLKIMKLQYELYFAKLLQTQAMRSIQNSPRYSILPMTPLSIPPPTGQIYANPEQLAPAVPQSSIPSQFQQQQQMMPGGQQQLLPDNWNMMMRNSNFINQPAPLAASYPNAEFMYRFPNQIDHYYNAPLLLHPNGLHQIPAPLIPLIQHQQQLGIPIKSGGSIPVEISSVLKPNADESLSQTSTTTHSQLINPNQNRPPVNENCQLRNQFDKFQTQNEIPKEQYNKDKDKEFQQIQDSRYCRDENKSSWENRTPETHQIRNFNENNSHITESFRLEQSQQRPGTTTGTNKFNFGKYAQENEDEDSSTDKYRGGEFYTKEPVVYNNTNNNYPTTKSKDKITSRIEAEYGTGSSSEKLQLFKGSDVRNDIYAKTDITVKNAVEKSEPINLAPENSMEKYQLNETLTTLPESLKSETIDKFESLSIMGAGSNEGGGSGGDVGEITDNIQYNTDGTLSKHYLNIEEKSRTPVMWNFNGRIDPENEILSTVAVPAPTQIQFSKKEKLSIENIENAIYGELINPVNQHTNKEYLPEPVGVTRPEPLDTLKTGFKDTSTNDTIHEKSDDSTEKREIIDDTVISKQLDNSYTTESAPVIQQPYDDNFIGMDNQQYPDEYNEQYFTESDPNPDVTNTNTTDNENAYQNYEYQQEHIPNNTDYQQSDQHIPENQNATETKPDTFINQASYETPEYQYPNEQNEYTNPEYQEYQNPEYEQVDYDQTDAYTYNYDQQADPNQQYSSEVFDEHQPQYSTETNYQPELLPSPSDNYQNYDMSGNMQTDDNNIGNSLNKEAEDQLVEPVNIVQQAIPVIKPEEFVSDVKPKPSVNVKPILSKDKSIDADKKKKRVNFVDSSETDDSSGPTKPEQIQPATTDESDFDFSSTN